MAKLKNGIYTEPQNPTPAQQKRRIQAIVRVRRAYEKIASRKVCHRGLDRLIGGL